MVRCIPGNTIEESRGNWYYADCEGNFFVLSLMFRGFVAKKQNM